MKRRLNASKVDALRPKLDGWLSALPPFDVRHGRRSTVDFRRSTFWAKKWANLPLSLNDIDRATKQKKKIKIKATTYPADRRPHRCDQIKESSCRVRIMIENNCHVVRIEGRTKILEPYHVEPRTWNTYAIRCNFVSLFAVGYDIASDIFTFGIDRCFVDFPCRT